MSTGAVMAAVTATFDGNAGITTAMGGAGRLYWMKADDGVSAPYVVAVGTDDAEIDTFGNAGAGVLVSLNIYTSLSLGPGEQVAIQAAIKTAFQKVQPAAITGYAFGKFARVGGFQIDDPDEFIHFVEQYAVTVHAA